MRNQRLNMRLVESSTFVDTGLRARTRNFYVVRAVNATNLESTDAAEVNVLTAATPLPCDPFLSLRQGIPVTWNNKPTEVVCT